MDILANIIRGGQLSLHALRMFRQVFNALLLWSCILAAVFFVYRSYTTISWGEITGLIDYYTAEAAMKLGMKQKNMVVTIHGYKRIITAEACTHTPYFQNIQNGIKAKLIRHLIVSYNIGWISFLLFSLVFIIRGLKKSGEQFSRGAQLNSFDGVKRSIKKHNKKADSYSIAGMPYPIGAEMEHTLVIGTTGVGKTVLISDLVEQIRSKGDRAIIYDKKCDYIQWFYDEKRDFILNPFDKRGKPWSLIREIENVAQIKSIAESFIPDRYMEDKIWDEAARLAFSGILEKLICTDPEITNEKLVNLLLKQDLEALAELVKGTYAQGTIDLTSPKTAASVVFVMAAHFNSLRLPKDKRSENFSIKNWIRESQNSILFISSQETLAAELMPLQTAWFEIAINGILSQKDSSVKTWVILDELPTLQKIPSLSRALSVSRSYGGCFVLSAQNIAQMKAIYGRNLVESISSECNTRALFKTNDPDTAEWISNNMGQSETLEYKEGVSYGASAIRDGVDVRAQEKLKHLVLPSEIQNLPKFNLFIKTANFGAVRSAVSYVNRTLINEPFILDSSIADGMRAVYQKQNIEIKQANVF